MKLFWEGIRLFYETIGELIVPFTALIISLFLSLAPILFVVLQGNFLWLFLLTVSVPIGGGEYEQTY